MLLSTAKDLKLRARCSSDDYTVHNCSRAFKRESNDCQWSTQKNVADPRRL